jgi:hypothetical protein
LHSWRLCGQICSFLLSLPQNVFWILFSRRTSADQICFLKCFLTIAIMETMLLMFVRFFFFFFHKMCSLLHLCRILLPKFVHIFFHIAFLRLHSCRFLLFKYAHFFFYY